MSNYVSKLKLSNSESIKLGLNPQLHFNFSLDIEKTRSLNSFCETLLTNELLKIFGDNYWGNQCLSIAAQSFAILQHYNIPCDLVYGDVLINDSQLYGASLEKVTKELVYGTKEPGMFIHAWINVGENHIIDPTLSSFLSKKIDSSFREHTVISGSAEQLLEAYKLDYQPIISGARFLDITCDIQLDYKVLV